MIRSHGVAQSVYDEIAALGLSCVDATCPFVAKIHQIVAQDYGPEGLVLIAGDVSIRRFRPFTGTAKATML